VVIVGSGAGGGTLGNELAQKGVKVVILEAGSRIELQDFVNDEWESFTQLAWSDMRTTSGSWRVARDFPNLPAWVVKAVGGSTTHWAGASLRFDEHEFKDKSTYGSIPGANLLDWPITLAEMEPWYAKAEDKMGVTRTNGMAIKIEHDASGKVTCVVYADQSGAMLRQKVRVVAVAGNSIESPRLLLNSASTMFPDGLANSSGQVGRNYMRHMTGSVYAAFEKSVHMYRGTTMAGIIRDEAKNDPKRGFV